ncbi:MAG: FAD-linked oxidase C-terminal domain-containing protein [Patescibacteria group bacterium]|jgi:FAD/FMN-containing dehydrogenase
MQQFGSEVCGLFKETKELFDPNNIFNPGKKVNGSLVYALQHLS